MSNVLELIYKTTQDNQLFLLLVIAMFLILVAIIIVVRSQNKNVRKIQEEKVEEDITYNIYSDNKEENVQQSILEQMVEESKEEKVLEPIVQEEAFDLKNITKELESLPKERTITLTPYELEQEEQAIISYDELVTQSIPRFEISEALREDVLTEYEYDVDKKYEDNVPKLEQLGAVVETVKEKDTYVHEESFLDDLKNLKNSLN